ncbi:MAG: bifunctional histidinol-phosphatase/imidazoleglycerol-phosphate dehydratase HisB [Chitinophagaceae bacterium]
MKKKILFIDRDGTVIKEAPPTYQLDSFSKLVFYPHVFQYLSMLARKMDYELIMITNQDGLGTPAFPEEKFMPVHKFVMDSLEGEGIHFSRVFIDKTFPADKAETRKPNIGMVKHFLDDEQYDIAGSYVIGDRLTDVQLAKNLGCKAIWLRQDVPLDDIEPAEVIASLNDTIVLQTTEWKEIHAFLTHPPRKIIHHRNTNETQISIEINLDGKGESHINTGLGFFDHMLSQVAKHGNLDLSIQCNGDLHIDEHHTIEDVSIAVGESVAKALGNKLGIERYAFVLPMDDSLASVAIDFGGRSWLVWDVEFKREKIGEMPTEMFYHFFKSFSDAANCNLNIRAEGENEHHKIESIFKAFARCLKAACMRDPRSNTLPTTKGLL